MFAYEYKFLLLDKTRSGHNWYFNAEEYKDWGFDKLIKFLKGKGWELVLKETDRRYLLKRMLDDQ